MITVGEIPKDGTFVVAWVNPWGTWADSYKWVDGVLYRHVDIDDTWEERSLERMKEIISKCNEPMFIVEEHGDTDYAS